jgi:hypothetical protein
MGASTQGGIKMAKYLIVQTIGKEITYKRYKTIDGWSRNPEECWQFSYLGAKKIVEGLNAGAAKSKFYKVMPHKMPYYSMKEV